MKKLINVCGTARCGSTMVDLILGNDPNAFSLGEINAWFRPYRTHHFDIRCSCHDKNCPWNELKKLKEKEFYSKAYDILNVDVLVDSSKDIAWVIDNNLAASRNGIKVYNLLLFKDPVSFLYSFWKRGFNLDRVRNNVYINYYNRCFESGLSFLSLNYNKFVKQPDIYTQKICNLFDIPYFEGKEHFWTKDHHQLFGSLGARKQVEKGESKIVDHELFHEDFIKALPIIENDNYKNKKLRKILTRLHDSELNQDRLDTSYKNIKKPFWYYGMKQKQKFKKLFPEKWNFEQ